MDTQLVKLNEKEKKFSIKSLINNKKMRILAFWIMINIFYLMAGSCLNTIHVISYNVFALGLIPLLVLNSIVGIVICVKGYYRRNIIHIFMVLIILFGIISTIFAINPKTAILGYENRYEGLFSIMYYFSLMFLTGFLNKKSKKNIVLLIIVTGIIQCIYGITQIYGEPNVSRIIRPTENPTTTIVEIDTWAVGFANNPNFFATYMLLCISYSIGLCIDEKDVKKSIAYIWVSMLFMYGLLISNTLSCIVGLFFVLVYTLIYSIKNKEWKKFIFIIIALLGITICTILQGKTTIVKDLNKTKSQTVEIAKGNIEGSYGTNRMYIWGETLKILPGNLLHGVGIDNFGYAFDGHPLYSPGRNFSYDKTHNEYLQILVTEGVFCFLSYLIMYAIVGFRGIKDSLKNKKIYLILPIIGYLIQAFFNISVIEVAPIFFIAMGLCMENEK